MPCLSLPSALLQSTRGHTAHATFNTFKRQLGLCQHCCDLNPPSDTPPTFDSRTPPEENPGQDPDISSQCITSGVILGFSYR